MAEDIDRIIKCLTLSVQDNEITNLQSLSWAINKLENFSMTFETLDKSRIGLTLQSVRHSKKISADISGRIRHLIKCWRQLLNVDCVSITPNHMRKNGQGPYEMNGVKNGVVHDNVVLVNGFNHNYSEKTDNHENHFKPKKKPEIHEKELISVVSKENDANPVKSIETMIEKITEKSPKCEPISSDVNIVESSEIPLSQVDKNLSNNEPEVEVTESQTCPSTDCKINSQIGKPKLKSTKELLADFSSLIDADTTDRILKDKIAQEDDDPVAYHPEEFRMREALQIQLLYQEPIPKFVAPSEPSVKSEDENEVKETKCEQLLKKFQELCPSRPMIVCKQMVPWKRMKVGIDCSAPTIKPRKTRRKILTDNQLQNRISTFEIDELLQSFEARAQRKEMITEAISQRKAEQVVDNTQSLTDISLKLKLKFQPPQLKLKKRKLKRKKKKRKLKIKVIVPREKKPRKPRIKPKPPITNYLTDLPKLPDLTEDLISKDESDETRTEFIFSDENVFRFTNEQVEGYNCTKHSQTSELLDLTKMYSVLIEKHYLHIFPWVDLDYPITTSFSAESDQIIQSALDLPSLFS